MKRCPKCLAAYEDSEKFCEDDGSPLCIDPLAMAPGPAAQAPESMRGSKDPLLLALVGALAGILLCVGVYFGFMASLSQADPSEFSSRPNRNESQGPGLSQQAAPRRTEPIESTGEEESETPETAETSPKESENGSDAAADNRTASKRLNDGPISTGSTRSSGVGESILEFTDGSAIKVEAAWEDRNGVWYRRGGLVSFVERNRVKSISESAVFPTQDAAASQISP